MKQKVGTLLRNLVCPILAESAFPNITTIFEILALYAWPPKTRTLIYQNSVLPSIAPLREVFWIILWSNSTTICFLSDDPARVQAPHESGLYCCSFPDDVWSSLCPIFWHLNLYWREGWICWCEVFRKTMILLETLLHPMKHHEYIQEQFSYLSASLVQESGELWRSDWASGAETIWVRFRVSSNLICGGWNKDLEAWWWCCPLNIVNWNTM